MKLIQKELTKNHINVLKYRLSKDEVPHFGRLTKLAPFISQKELKEYVNIAKKQYDSLLSIPKGKINE
jgi:hypothetical protein